MSGARPVKSRLIKNFEWVGSRGQCVKERWKSLYHFSLQWMNSEINGKMILYIFKIDILQQTSFVLLWNVLLKRQLHLPCEVCYVNNSNDERYWILQNNKVDVSVSVAYPASSRSVVDDRPLDQYFNPNPGILNIMEIDIFNLVLYQLWNGDRAHWKGIQVYDKSRRKQQVFSAHSTFQKQLTQIELGTSTYSGSDCKN